MNAFLVLANVCSVNEDELQAHRRSRLAEWLAGHGGASAVVSSRRLKPSYQSYLSQVIGGYSFGSRGARNCEEKLGIPSGWLDSDPPPQHAVTTSSTGSTLNDALTMVLDALAACSARTELRQLLPMLIDTNAPAYRQRLAELLGAPGKPLGAPIAPEQDDRLRQMAERAEEAHARNNNAGGTERRRSSS
ncbi:hypothetical protein ACG02S_07890 [Roseateles sp. DC23W]|uniref:Uncharacterized protein n=1 Tax=Pelomonas dachongensis TaxID=3299029 RepID=A0ABW7EK27_9BURK